MMFFFILITCVLQDLWIFLGEIRCSFLGCMGLEQGLHSLVKGNYHVLLVESSTRQLKIKPDLTCYLYVWIVSLASLPTNPHILPRPHSLPSSETHGQLGGAGKSLNGPEKNSGKEKSRTILTTIVGWFDLKVIFVGGGGVGAEIRSNIKMVTRLCSSASVSTRDFLGRFWVQDFLRGEGGGLKALGFFGGFEFCPVSIILVTWNSRTSPPSGWGAWEACARG